MATLHLINSESALEACLPVAAKDDSLLLLGAAANLTVAIERSLFALADDVPDAALAPASVVLINYEKFVELASTHQPIVTWR